MKYKISAIVLTVAAMMSLALIFNTNDDKAEITEISIIRFGILPDKSGDRSITKYSGIFQRVQERTGLEIKIILPKTYAELTELFKNKEVDIAYFGGVTFLKAHNESGALPLVMRDVDMKFTSHFLVRKDGTSSDSVADYRGKRLAFGSDLSTSGHLMPRHFMLEENIDPEEFFSEVVYSGAHDKTAILVRDGKADIGALNAHVADAMFKDGRLNKDTVRILHTTPPYPDYVWAVQPYVAKDLRIIIRDVFAELSRNNKKDKAVLAAAGAGHFVPASMKDFEELQKIASRLQIFGN